MRGAILLLLWGFVAVSAAAPQCSLEEHDVDFDEGDIQPLGSGFRNATSAGDCCAQCAAVAGCLYYSYSGSSSQEGGEAPAQGGRHPPRHTASSSVFPPHNCWLKASFGARVKRGGRTSGAVGPLPPTPAPAPPWPDACNGAAGCPLGAQGQCAWCDVSAPVAARVAALVAALTLAEKVVQISTFTPGTVPGAPRVGLPPFSYHSEGLHGVRCAGPKTLGLVATLFPQVLTGAFAFFNLLTTNSQLVSLSLLYLRWWRRSSRRRRRWPPLRTSRSSATWRR